MATEITYSAKTNITITLASLASAGVRGSAAVDNGTNKYVDAVVAGKIKTGAAPAATGTMSIFAYASVNDGTNYSGGSSGTDAAVTLDGTEVVLGAFPLDGANEQIYLPQMSVAAAFGGHLPEDWGIIIRNGSGATLSATAGDHEFHYKGIKYADV